MEQISFFENKKILISGGGGYLGSKLAEKLSSYNCEVFLLDLKFNNISNRLTIENSNIKQIQADLTNKVDLKEKCQKIKADIIFHFAALLLRERSFENYNKLYEVNVKGTLNLLESLKETEYQRFVYASSSELYGNNESPFNENQIPKPVSPYSLTKLMGEHLTENYSITYNKPFSIYRIFNFYGEEMPPNFFLSQLEDALENNQEFKMTKGEQIRDFLSVDDLCNKMIAVTSNDNSVNETINICSGKGKKIIELATEIATKKNKLHLLKVGALEYRQNEVWEMIGDDTKLHNLINV